MTDAFASPGGVQLVNRNIARALDSHPALEIEFFSLMDTGPDSRYVAASAFRGFGGGRSCFVAAVTEAFLTRGYAALLITHRNLFPAAIFWKTAVRRPYLLFAHGIEIWDRQRPWYRMALRQAQRVLTNSHFTRDRMCLANSVPAERTEVVPLCLDEIGMPDCAISPDESGALTLLTLGRSNSQEGYKGQDTVIRAMPQILKSYPQARYVLAGGGDDQPRLRDLAQQLGVGSQVEFLGQVSDAERNELFRHAAIFLMPSRGEGFGVVYLEAMNYHLPCIAGNGDGGREAVRDGVNGFAVDPASPQAVAGAVERLLADAALRWKMGEAGFQMRQTEFSFARFSTSLYKAVEQAAAGGNFVHT